MISDSRTMQRLQQHWISSKEQSKSMAKPSSDRNRWDYFWSEYMVWSVRLICYFSGVLFWDSMRSSLDAIIQIPLLPDAILWGYSILCFGFLEQQVKQKYRPRYDALTLSDEAKDDRIRKERLMITAWTYCGVNFILGTIASLLVHREFSIPAVLGLVGLLAASLCTVVGSAMMAARNSITGELNPVLMFMGLCMLVPTVGYVAFMFHYEFLS